MQLLLPLGLATLGTAYVLQEGTTCILYPESLKNEGQAVDDAPSIHEAFELCGTDGEVIFTDHTFHINSVLNTTNLANCDVVLRGELRFSDDIEYWLANSYSVVFQDQSTAWLFGERMSPLGGKGAGTTVTAKHGIPRTETTATNPVARSVSLFMNPKNLWVDHLNITQPQFWATFVSHSYNVSITNFYVSAISNDEWGTVNTDGYDSWNSDTLLVENAYITNGDDCIAVKGNTTNLTVRNVVCNWGFGMAVGSLGQYPATPDYVENILFEDIVCNNCMEAAFIKTWQGIPEDDSSNGDAGGGGSGTVKNVQFRNFELTNVALPIQISQCIYNEAENNCNTSKMAISDVTWSNIKGTTRYNVAASIYCSDLHPCPGIRFEDVELQSVNSTLGLPMSGTNIQHEVYQCQNIIDQEDSGVPCNRVAPDNYSQVVSSNISDDDDSDDNDETPGTPGVKNGPSVASSGDSDHPGFGAGSRQEKLSFESMGKI
ncbi:hypothetical protein N7468_003420 [Penicillium chermesinum]|uniref:galacturonan 1,4-alpha-galacturonidase n=1 Tax=Penicillium chermesinum TaxID=63820 RepID=A0A9W9P6D8_9EURO|nr:uncharacterized protein N7468_003420 [Penicillium chermesinum]KAJ5238801.1 hypothetical protein N7468_003420 [Penicillium chermesinum]